MLPEIPCRGDPYAFAAEAYPRRGMVDPLVGSVASFGAILVPVLIARSAHPSASRRPHGVDHGAMAEIEEHDVEQMLDGIAERRRRNGKPALGDELADGLLRDVR